jgi:hypothetical protein
VTELLDDAGFLALFDAYDHTAFRLETRDRYSDPQEVEPLRRFLAGEPPDDTWFMDWYEDVSGWTSDGKRMERVRVVTEPLSEYIRWEMDLVRLNSAAGEDIRYLPRARAKELGLPDEDYWLFDSRRVAVLRIDDDGVRLGVEVIDDPAEVVKRCYWRDAAWHYAIPWSRYSAS